MRLDSGELVADAQVRLFDPDANLRAAIAAALGKASGATITVADMTRLTTLRGKDAGIRDLTGLEFASNLKWLSLPGNAISDISALRGLTNLIWLNLKGQPLNAASINDHIPALQRSGATVSFDPLLRESDFDVVSFNDDGDDAYAGWAGPDVLRETSHLSVVGCMGFNLHHSDNVDFFLDTALHEIGHVLGIGTQPWDNNGFVQKCAANS